MCGPSDEPATYLKCNKCGKTFWLCDWEGRERHDKKCNGKLE